MRKTDNRTIVGFIVLLIGIAITVSTVWWPRWRHESREVWCLDRLDAAAEWSCGEYFGQQSGGPARYWSYT